MRIPGAVLVAITSILALGLVCFTFAAPSVEAEIEMRTLAALADVGVRDLRVNADGRDVTLAGTIAFAEIGVEAVRRATSLPGVRRVADELEVAARPSFEFGPDGDVWVLRGRLPTAESRQELFDAAAAIVGQGNVIDEMEVDSSVTQPTWLGTLPRLVQLLRAVDGRPRLGLEDGAVTLAGHTSSVGLRDYLVLQIAMIGADSGAEWTVVDSLRIAPVSRNEHLERRIASLLEDESIAFRGATAALTEPSLAAVARVGERLAGYSNIRIEILGHADAAQNEAANRELSQARAEAVRNVLARRIDSDRLVAIGYGDQRRADRGRIGEPIEFRVLHRP